MDNINEYYENNIEIRLFNSQYSISKTFYREVIPIKADQTVFEEVYIKGKKFFLIDEKIKFICVVQKAIHMKENQYLLGFFQPKENGELDYIDTILRLGSPFENDINNEIFMKSLQNINEFIQNNRKEVFSIVSK